MKMNKEKLHRTSVLYIENFLDDVRHIKNRVIVKTVTARMAYGSVIKIKIYQNLGLGHWERYCKNILRVKSQMDLTLLHSTLNHYATILQYMYDNDETDSDN